MKVLDQTPKIGEWVPFVSIRHKEYYDVLLRTGVIIESLYPNGDGWSLLSKVPTETEVKFANSLLDGLDYIKDDQIAAFRMVSDKDIRDRNLSFMTGDLRLKRMTSNKAFECYSYLVERNEMIKPHDLRELVNLVTKTAKLRAHSDSLREALKSPIKKILTPFLID